MQLVILYCLLGYDRVFGNLIVIISQTNILFQKWSSHIRNIFVRPIPTHYIFDNIFLFKVFVPQALFLNVSFYSFLFIISMNIYGKLLLIVSELNRRQTS